MVRYGIDRPMGISVLPWNKIFKADIKFKREYFPV
jgi:hypothetical protein